MSAPTDSTPSTSAVVYIYCMGTTLGPGFLNGYTGAGTVDLQPNANGGGVYSGTVWKLIRVGSSYSIQCLGLAGGSTYLSGDTQNMTVSLVPAKGEPSTLWKLAPGQPNQPPVYTIQLADTSAGPFYLNGNTGDSEVNLSSTTGPDKSGTYWLILESIKL